MTRDMNTKIFSPILEEAHNSITPQERAAFDLNFSISEKIYQILQDKGMTKRDLAKLTGKNAMVWFLVWFKIAKLLMF